MEASAGLFRRSRSLKPLLKVRLVVPIYDAHVWLVVSKNVRKERRKWEYLFGPAPDGDYNALCCYSSCSTFGLFFRPEALTNNIIGHEVFHLTHRMLDWVEANFDKDHHEQGALLHGYLLDWIFSTLKQHRSMKGL